ncbi:MAG: glycosyltransferase [Sulfitobacter sp.]|uniref:glycosyltransferase n=1 Tax=Sulfitobacter sp. TaxID=1903071 RepID=UPI003297FA9B
MSKLTLSPSAGVPSLLVRKSRRVVRSLLDTGVATQIAAKRASVSGRKCCRVLLLSDGIKGTSEQQFAPLRRFRQTIASELGLVFEFDSTDSISTISKEHLSGYAAVGLKLAFDTPAERAAVLAQTLFDAAREAGAKCLVFDGDDDPCVIWPEVINACDTYIKKHQFSDLKAYKRGYHGKTNLTDYAHQTFAVDFSANIIPETLPLEEDQIAKIALGWNIGLDDKIYDLSRDLSAADLCKPKTIDISCRASVAPDTWTYGMRNGAVKAMRAFEDKMRVHAPDTRVPQQEYYNEMLSSWLTLSPFGYGELCWRDFEAILCGSILVKPDMSHVATYPDIFIPGETYLPVAWDYRNLEEVCVGVLQDTELRDQIRHTARQRLLEALTAQNFVARLESTMKAAAVLNA